MQFSTKASTLALLRDKLRAAQIASLVWFTVDEWNKDRTDCIKRVSSGMKGAGPWIVRSSCQREDGLKASNAGAFLSLSNIKTSDLENAIEKVIASYGSPEPRDEILVQPMLKNVKRSGVALSHDPNTCAPYRVISWAEGSDTNSVTGGLGGRTWQKAASSVVPCSPIFEGILVLLDELLELFDNVPIDCEFAVTEEKKSDVLWLLQARPLILPHKTETPDVQATRLRCIENKINDGMQPHPFLMGRSTVYGVMPDWNPAEIVGTRPKPLALSLYRDLITDSIWAYQRHNYGYRNAELSAHATFFGLPYIDVRLSFNSFIPADLDEVCWRLVDYYINRLLSEPNLHDKVEFEIVFSCYTLDLNERLERLAEAGFTENERKAIASSLQQLTNRIVHPMDGLWKSDAAKLDILGARREKLQASNINPLERVYWLWKMQYATGHCRLLA